MPLKFLLPIESLNEAPDMELYEIMEYNLGLWVPRSEEVFYSGPYNKETFVDALWAHATASIETACSNVVEANQHQRYKLYVRIVAAGMADFYKRVEKRGWGVPKLTIGALLQSYASRWPQDISDWYFLVGEWRK